MGTVRNKSQCCRSNQTDRGRKEVLLSDSGSMGFGPLALQEDDMVCIVQGCDVPLLICETGLITA
jgi:hypothetical protein